MFKVSPYQGSHFHLNLDNFANVSHDSIVFKMHISEIFKLKILRKLQ